ncbi:DUF1479 domain protein [Cordyceps fumosorosea ARSEF 2679]|uniref:DUF1479 domain protein n=1 Tax=Cordyceps fumosorosea (strain ARSEF 2679) TaxID=1081104 RepID=A0A167QMX1_CORFA|nr:DUF1479 domain protein [Cordyceps fumosorosea ARSEF 2679]OAA57785.1 DUF1479 domain protein [Cordyceps fumosorosea ARSEF 2679]
MLRSCVSKSQRRSLATVAAGAGAGVQKSSKKEGDISDAFVSLSGAKRDPLPDRFRELKCELVRGREKQITDSWNRLLRDLRKENEIIAQKGSDVVPQVEFANLESGLRSLKDEIKKRGAVVVRGVVPEAEARAYKEEVEDYVKRNPWTRAFPADNPQVYELYWSAPQLKARSHPNFMRVQRRLMGDGLLWHASDPTSPISLAEPLSYADRLRIRQPGDATFALGPHIDGGSVERWEPTGYGLGGAYDAVFAGAWEAYDPWDASGRVGAVNNLYDGLGACSMFRAWQGWLSMSGTRPGEGTLLVNPLMHRATAYVLLRPFFEAKDTDREGRAYLEGDNWALVGEGRMTSELQGASPGHGQELTEELHPHLELERTMVHVPEIKPGDFVAWHCDTIHAVDKQHRGASDSSVLYIPVCPLTAINARYVARQREAWRRGTPGPDFPGGEGEARHAGRPAEAALRGWAGTEALRSMGLEKLVPAPGATAGQREVLADANAILGF